MQDVEKPISFGALLRQYRLAARLTQEKLAERSGLGVRSVQNLERGANYPHRETLRRLVHGLDLADEYRTRFEVAAGPASRGPRGMHLRAASGKPAGNLEVVLFPERRWHDRADSPVTTNDGLDRTVASWAREAPNNLPPQRTSFVGREQALSEVQDLLHSNHLLTLIGTGGCGKTRLALEVARRQLDDYPDGVWLVDLAPLVDPSLVGQAMASVVGLRETPGKLMAHTLTDYFRAKQALLVVDNCEHVIEAVAHLVDAILLACPLVRILATSREALRIPGEVDWRVPSLEVPATSAELGVENLMRIESVQLFAERAQAARIAFNVTSQNAAHVANICRQLDGIPLAIELAARQVTILPTEKIATGLAQRFRLLTTGSRTALPRQQTLAAMVTWSYERLTEPAQNLFDRLSVFAGGFTLDAARVVSGHPEDVIAPLTELVSKSMVVADGGRDGVERYHLLETLRQFGRERLVLAGEAEIIQDRHATFYLGLAQAAQPYILGPDQLSYLASLYREWDNIRVAMHWFLERRAADEGLRLAAALEFPIWYRGLDNTEAYAWRSQLLKIPGEMTPHAARANALMWVGQAASSTGDGAEGSRDFEQALAMARRLGDGRLVAWVKFWMSRCGSLGRGHWSGASWEPAREAVAEFRAAGDRWGIAMAQSWLGHLAFHLGDPEHAVLLRESLEIAREVGDRQCVAWVLRYLGEATSVVSDAEAREQFNESLLLYNELGNVWGVACVEYFLGRLDLLHDRCAEACEHYRTALRWFRDLDWPQMLYLCIDGLAQVAARQRQCERAIRLASMSAHLRVAIGIEVSPVEQTELNRALVVARKTLGEPSSVAAAREGEVMTPDQAIAYALSDAVAFQDQVMAQPSIHVGVRVPPR